MAHAMKTLKFKFAVPGDIENHAGGIGIVGGKLREYRVLGIEQYSGTVLITEVGIGFAGEYRIAFKAQFLGMFDFGIPVGTFNQSHH